MLLIANDPFGTPIAYGTGYIYAKGQNAPVQEFVFEKATKLMFLVTTSIKRVYDAKSDDPDKYMLNYESNSCELYLSGNNTNMYAALKEAKMFERVNFYGRVIKRTQKLETGESVTTQVIRLESLEFPDRVAAMLLGKEMTRSELFTDAYQAATESEGTQTNTHPDDDYDF